MHSPEWPTIRSGPVTARFLPRNGGRMSHLAHDTLGDILVPTSNASFDAWNWPREGAYPLFPFHNRLSGAAFEYEGRRFRVRPHPALGVDAQHGPAHRRPWSMVDLSTNKLALALDYSADEDWPFSFRAEQRFVLTQYKDKTDLEIELWLINTDTEPMPGGFGWHPYFLAGPSEVATCDAASIWPVNDDGIPSGAPPNQRSGSEPLPQPVSTIFLSDWRQAHTMTTGGARVAITADNQLNHLVAHRTDAYLCLEPVSHLAGALGRAQNLWKINGMFVLQPGERRTAKVWISICD